LKTLKKILLINDDPAVTTLLKTYLLNKTTKIILAHTYLEVLSVLKTNNFDLILTDISITGTSGFQLIETIKNSNLGCKIIVITGMDQENQQTMFKQFGISSFLNFPVSLNALNANIKEVL